MRLVRIGGGRISSFIVIEGCRCRVGRSIRLSWFLESIIAFLSSLYRRPGSLLMVLRSAFFPTLFSFPALCDPLATSMSQGKSKIS